MSRGMQAVRRPSLGQLLRSCREERGLTQEELAEQVGISTGSLSALERDRARPRRYTLDRLLAAFALTPDATAEVVQAWRSSGRAARSEQPPPATFTASPASGFARPLTSFVGRRDTLAETTRLLAIHRMLTLTGVGGVGKTRLAVHLASQLAGDFPGGVFFADLSAVSEPSVVPFVVLAALGLRDVAASGAVPVAIAYLRDRRALLLLDNCEHLVEASAELASHLLAAAPELRVLATSRRPLGVAGEATVAIPGLGLPDLTSGADPNQAAASEAVQLFAERAATALPTFRIDDGNAVDVGRLCDMLDGLPLAIELAAVRLRSLGLEAMTQRLTYRLDLLRGSGPAFKQRQQTLRAVLDWSHDLLNLSEQRLFRRLAVLPGTFDLEAAETICTDQELPRKEALLALTGLVEQSMVARVEGSEVRYRLLETVGQYAREKLEAADECVAFERRHRDRSADFARAMRAAWWGPSQRQTLDRLDAEYPNLRAALDWCVLASEADAEVGLAMCCDLFVFWQWGSHLSEGRQYVSALLDRCPAPSPIRAEAQALAGFVALMQGDDGRAEAWLRESADVSQQLGADRVRVQPLAYLGMLASARACYEQADALLREALALAETHDRTWLPRIQHLRADVALNLGQPKQAVALLVASIAECELTGEQWVRQRGLALLGLARAQLGEHAEAVRLLERARMDARLLGDWRGTAMCLDGLGWTAAAAHQHLAAARLLGAADAAWQLGAGSVPSFWRSWRERCVHDVQQALGPSAFALARHAGQAHPDNATLSIRNHSLAL
jgi:non-specific serine/threonine protein kinase